MLLAQLAGAPPTPHPPPRESYWRSFYKMLEHLLMASKVFCLLRACVHCSSWKTQPSSSGLQLQSPSLAATGIVSPIEGVSCIITDDSTHSWGFSHYCESPHTSFKQTINVDSIKSESFIVF